MIATDPPIQRIAILRALHLGDLLVATPALRSIRLAFPTARITLVGLPWAASLASRLPSVDDFLALPGYPGLPDVPVREHALPAFFSAAWNRQFDLAIQLHGSGNVVNALLARLGARRQAGFYPAGTHCPDTAHFLPWPDTGAESQRLLALTRFLGFPDAGVHLNLPITPADRRESRRLLDASGVGRRAYAIVHPGARFPSRRWPAERFAQVATHLARRGLQIVLTGTRDEAPLAASVAAHMRTSPAADLTGRTDLGTLAALVDGARLVLANDTGLSHVAAARRRPSVIVASGGDAARWAPSDGLRHRVLHHDVSCRPCLHETCPTGHECAHGVSVAAACQAADALVPAGVRHAA